MNLRKVALADTLGARTVPPRKCSRLDLGGVNEADTRVAEAHDVGAVVCDSRAAAQVTEIGKAEGQVTIVAWPGYIERGETDKKYDWVTKFEEASGCKVNVKTANTSDEMVALMNEGGFDLVTASGDASLRLVAGKRVQPINIDLIKSW